MNREAARLRHLAAVAHEREARHVRGGVRIEALESLRAVLVQRDHGIRGHLHARLVQELGLVRGGENARAERLREHQGIALARGPVGEHAVEVDEPGDGQAELGLVVVDGVAARHDNARLAALVRAARQNLARDLEAQAVGEAQEVEREHWAPAHGPHVGECVRGRYLAKQERVVHHRREEVRRAHKAPAMPQVVDVRVVGRVEAHEQLRVFKPRQLGEHLREVSRREFGRAARGLHELGQLDSGHIHGDRSPFTPNGARRGSIPTRSASAIRLTISLARRLLERSASSPDGRAPSARRPRSK